MPAALARRICTQCRKPLAPAHFEIVRRNDAGKVTYAMQVCSVICVGRWALQFGLGGVQSLLKKLK